MSLYLKTIVIIFTLAYLVSPMDIIPEMFIPYVGWIDDGFILWVIYYLLRYNRLPELAFFKKNGPSSFFKRRPASGTENPGGRSGPRNRKEQASSQTGRTFQESDNPYEVLGLKPDATPEQIQAAYRELAKKYHPDRLSHLGEDFAHLANEKFLAIQKAYDKLNKP